MQKIHKWFYQDLETTKSTNDSVLDLLEKVKAPCIVSAKIQTLGRGRLGRSWEGKEGNLFVSFAYEIELQNLTHYALLSGLSVLKSVQFFISAEKVKVKWPNDVFVEGKKISGILFEKGPEKYWIMGIGVNVAQTPEVENPMYEVTSLKDYNIQTTREEFLQKLVENFDNLKAQYEERGFEPIRKAWLDNAYNRGKKVIIKQNGQECEGIFESIGSNGELILKTKDGLKNILVGDLFEGKK